MTRALPERACLMRWWSFCPVDRGDFSRFQGSRFQGATKGRFQGFQGSKVPASKISKKIERAMADSEWRERA